MNILRFGVFICSLNVLIAFYLLGGLHDMIKKDKELGQFFEQTCADFLDLKSNVTQDIAFLRVVSGNIIAGLADSSSKKRNRRTGNFNQLVLAEIEKINGENFTEFHELFQFNSLFQTLLEQPFTKSYALIESFVKLQITLSVYLQLNVNGSSELRNLLEQMLIKTCSTFLIEHSQPMIVKPTLYISDHYKSFYLG